MPTETIEVQGHIIDSLILAKILDLIVESGAGYTLVSLDVGNKHTDPSHAVLEIAAASDAQMALLLERLHPHGAHPVDEPDVTTLPAPRDGVLPDGFYSTTNLPTQVRREGRWIDVANPEMDCALVVAGESGRTVPMHRIAEGEQVVIGREGVRVHALERPRGRSPFEFMASEVSSEKPKGLLVAQVARRIRANREDGRKLLAVCGPAVIHTGAGPDLAAMVRAGWVDVLFAGNGFATHDIESNIMGTSLGVSLSKGTPTEGGHANHLRVINAVRGWGSIAEGVRLGHITGGVMFECAGRGVPFVLAGSIRDDGPLPDVISSAVEAQDAMRGLVDGVGVALMLASTLHAIATGNLLPAGVETYCIDINQAVVTKLTDRGSHQALGIVTDAGLFCRLLASELL